MHFCNSCLYNAVVLKYIDLFLAGEFDVNPNKGFVFADMKWIFFLMLFMAEEFYHGELWTEVGQILSVTNLLDL